MRYVIAAMLASILAACSGLPPSPGPSCSSKAECEIRAYNRAGG